MQNNLFTLIDKICGHKIMVIGDVVADVYLEGKISRISREAPVLVLEHAGETVVPGGAANVIHNAATLGGAVYAVGVIGNDDAGRRLAETLEARRVQTAGLIVDAARPTITKTRVMAGGLATVRQQVVRIDRESKKAVDAEISRRLVEYAAAHLGDMSAVIMSDYGSGTISPELRQLVIAACREKRIPCIVDSRYDILAFAGVTVVKQNEAETAAALGCASLTDGGLEEAGRELLRRIGAEAVLVTRGPEGMSVFERSGEVTHIPVTNISEVFDVSGAGDTVVVAMALALAAGASYADAARLANFAAGVVVRKPGTATVTLEELCQAIGAYDGENR
ncbi:MAG TPA: PfkB family carbohydrate kinase [Selenomonadales bacterium]|nr:PfkB family carbohydrate kinase [Selenomonadales bacterium]